MYPSRHILGLLLLLALSAPAQSVGSDMSDEAFALSARQARERIAHERAQATAHYEAQEVACRQRFFVNRCTRQVEDSRRELLAGLRRQEVQLEQAERQRRQSAALQRVADKQQDRDRRGPSPELPR